MTVFAGIIPTHAMIAERIPGCSNSERQLVGADWMAGVRPHLSTRMSCRQRINRHVEDPGNFRRTLLAFDSERDRNLLHPEVLSDKWRECRHGSPRRASEDRAQCFGLLLVSTFIDIGSHRPISFPHRARRVDCERHIQAIERDVTVPTAFDVEVSRFSTTETKLAA